MRLLCRPLLPNVSSDGICYDVYFAGDGIGRERTSISLEVLLDSHLDVKIASARELFLTKAKRVSKKRNKSFRKYKSFI